MTVYLAFWGGAGWAAAYATPRRWLTPNSSRACRWSGS